MARIAAARTERRRAGGVMTPLSTAVADVLALRHQRGWLSPPLVPVVGGAGVVAAARTVTLVAGPGGMGSLFDLLGDDLTGRALIVSAPDDHAAVWGELLATAAAGAGAAAVLVAGAVRDVGACVALGVATWARAVATVGPAGALTVSSIGEPVLVGATQVADGDTVVVDLDGVVAVPAATAAAVLADAEAYAAAERDVVAALAAGEPLRHAYRHKADAVTRLLAGAG